MIINDQQKTKAHKFLNQRLDICIQELKSITRKSTTNIEQLRSYLQISKDMQSKEEYQLEIDEQLLKLGATCTENYEKQFAKKPKKRSKNN